MPDVHLAEEVCVGCVVATRRLLYPAAIGGDLGCGMTAIRFDCPADRLAGDQALARRILDRMPHFAPPRRQRGRPAERPLPAELEAMPLSTPSLRKLRERDGRLEFGTLGRGNHFLELQRDDEGWLWLMVHSGSRALGPAIARTHRGAAAIRSQGFEALAADDLTGRAFLEDLAFALAFASASRRHMAKAVAALLEDELAAVADETSWIECTHNLVRRETIGEDALWIHRKGAIPAAEGASGVIPGSMGSPSFHVEGRGCDAALHSSSHGAGRRLARGEARRRIAPRELVREMRGIFFDERRAADLVDESPAAYKDLGKVMRAQRELTRIVRRVTPVLGFKGT
jgi:tRNA-splicing ligase RtcB